MNRAQAQQLLQTALANPTAEFRDGQWEAIDALVNQRQKLLVVQRTGWGKSSVYFISTKIFRDQGISINILSFQRISGAYLGVTNFPNRADPHFAPQ